MENYFELKINVNPQAADLVSDICFDCFDCVGVILAEEAYKDLKLAGTTEGVLKAYIKSDADIDKTLSDKRSLFIRRGFSDSDLGSWDYTISRVENRDWSEKWKEKWTVTHVTDRIAVVPDWIEYTPDYDEIVIKLEPGSAFGTGTHQTTQLCMKATEKYMQPAASVADIGTGSGILSVYAKKIGAHKVIGIDNDENVIGVACENARKNNVECKFALMTADKLDEQYDLVLANILHNVLTVIMKDLKKITKPGGIIVLSGILDEKKHVVLDAVSKYDLQLLEEAHQDQWTALIVKRSK